jgi:cytochrome c
MKKFTIQVGLFTSIALLLAFLSPSCVGLFTKNEKSKTKILIINSPFDHPYGTHMYQHEGRLLARSLEQTPGIEVVLSNGWPKDLTVLQDVQSLVFYSKSAFEIMMTDPTTREQALQLLNRKIGLACIHMSTLTAEDEMIDLLGARWYFKWLPSGLNLDVRHTSLQKIDPAHPISRGWNEFGMRDEIYMSTIFHPKASPLVKVDTREGEEIVAWTFERAKGGRSFGTTLGHFHENFRIEAFRRLLVNGILWTAGVKVASNGADVAISLAEDILPPNPLAVAANKAEPFDEARFEKQVLVADCHDPMQLEITKEGHIYFIERNGNLRFYNSTTKVTSLVGRIPVYLTVEVGLLGLALDRNFEKNQAIYLFFSPQEKKKSLRLSRFNLKEGLLDLSAEKILLEYDADTENGHQGGGLYMCSNGDLLIGTGDNTNHMAELPVDQRKGRELFDAQRTSANTASLRGKILRIHPMPDGSYGIPRDNLFRGGDQTRPEIFAMGVRNGFRVTEDPLTGWVYWGDVGQNIDPALGIGPNGYDEINQARAAGNFGWPMFTGPNEPYKMLDFSSKKPGHLFDVSAPQNNSPNNTGLIDLPPPQGAFIWYPSALSGDFPMLGSGGRSAMVGPVYYWMDSLLDSEVRMPAAYDNSVFIFDWMRNWIKVVKLDMQGKVEEILPFMPSAKWRKPIDIKLGPDQSLYVVELGDRWTDNKDSQISRIIYRRGNRPPVAGLTVSPLAGKHPLTVTLDAGISYDKDADAKLTFAWEILGKDGKAIPDLAKNEGSRFTYTFTQPGSYTANVTVTDQHGASSQASSFLSVGNTIPEVTLLKPDHGGFFDWELVIEYQISVKDAEDGASDKGKIDPSRVLVTSSLHSRWERNMNLSDTDLSVPGLQLMRKTTCFSCHQTYQKSLGPAYVDIAKRYVTKPEAREELAHKIIQGSQGSWGMEAAMPPHPQHVLSETQLMVDWILSLVDSASQVEKKGFVGKILAPSQSPSAKRKKFSSVLAIHAEYIDNGAAGLPPLRGEATHILRSRLQMAYNYSRAKDVEVVELFEGGEGRCVQFKANGFIVFDAVNLKDVAKIRCRLEPLSSASPVWLEVRRNNSEGQLLASTLISGEKGFQESELPLTKSDGLHDIVFVVKAKETTALLNLAWIEFLAANPK